MESKTITMELHLPANQPGTVVFTQDGQRSQSVLLPIGAVVVPALSMQCDEQSVTFSKLIEINQNQNQHQHHNQNQNHNQHQHQHQNQNQNQHQSQNNNGIEKEQDKRNERRRRRRRRRNGSYVEN